MPQPFLIEIEQEQIDDLHRRLAATRWPDEIANGKWEYGASKSYLQELCGYWQHGYSWKARQAYLNSFLHYKETIDDAAIHFLHHKGTGNSAIPILLIHGWPDSFVRFLELIPLLTKADDKGISFDVVVPSLPGFGFSDLPQEPGMNPKKMAALFAKMMKSLGYEKFIAHGGDWGSSITEALALYHTDQLLGIHLTDVPSSHAMMPVDDPSAAEKIYLEEHKVWQQTEGGYFMIQSTKPQTLAYGLNDSPAGICGWIVEKFKSWTDNDGKIEDAIKRDMLLDNISIYWFTQTINSANRIYYEAMKAIMQSMHNPLQKLNPFDKTGKRSELPAGFALFPKDISSPPREFADRFFNVKRWSKMKQGGHFAAMEEPQDLADELSHLPLQLFVNDLTAPRVEAHIL